jgi:hypothetical protein
MSGPYIGVRDTRRIVGLNVLTLEDLQKTTRHDDAVATDEDVSLDGFHDARA